MVIGFDASRAFSKDRTGTENYSYQLLKALTKIDKKNQYIVYLRTQGPTLQGWSRLNRGWPDNFHFKVINWPRFWTQAGLAGQTFRDKLDVLFVPAHTLPIIRKPGLKTVITIHDLGSEYLPNLHQLKQRLYLSIMQRYQLKSASKIIAVSQATKNDLIKRVGISPVKIKVVYEGYDKKLFSAKGGAPSGRKDDALVNSLRQYGLKIGRYFLFVGTVQPRKNLERVIKAFSLHLSASRQKSKQSVSCRLSTVDLQLVIAGSKGWLSDEIYRLPNKLGIEGRVKFLGYVPDGNLPVLYGGAKALVFPSLFEGFGLPILEAQACGCPVITSKLSSMPEIAGHGAILVDPYSEDDIVRGMEKLEDRRWRIEYRKLGFENIKRFSWEKCAEETLEVLEKL